MRERAIEPGRYALHPDGTWRRFTDRAELDFKPTACVTVKAPKPIAEEAAAPLPAPVPAPVVAVAPRPQRKPKPFKLGVSRAPGSARAARIVPPADPVPDTRTANPADVFRAVADQFGILPAMGQSRSCARFKPLVRRDEEGEAADAYARAVEDRRDAR